MHLVVSVSMFSFADCLKPFRSCLTSFLFRVSSVSSLQ